MDKMTDSLFKTIKEHKPSIIGLDQCLKSAVCIALLDTPEGLSLLFERRSSKIDAQPGDICFPGGMMEDNETAKHAAAREVMEELLVKRDQIEILAPFDIIYMEKLVIFPFVGSLSGYEGTFNEDEVSEVFTVPLSFFVNNDPETYRLDVVTCPEENFPYDRIVGGRNYKWRDRRENVYFYQYKDYTIWGLTAKIVKSFVEMLKRSGYRQ